MVLPWQSYGASPAIWDHTVLPEWVRVFKRCIKRDSHYATRHKWTRPALTPARRRVLDLLTLRDGMLSWPIAYPEMQPPGIELATSWSQVRPPNHYTAEPPVRHLCRLSDPPQLNSLLLLIAAWQRDSTTVVPLSPHHEVVIDISRSGRSSKAPPQFVAFLTHHRRTRWRDDKRCCGGCCCWCYYCKTERGVMSERHSTIDHRVRDAKIFGWAKSLHPPLPFPPLNLSFLLLPLPLPFLSHSSP